MPIDAFSVSCAQPMRNLLAIAKFLLNVRFNSGGNVLGGRKIVRVREMSGGVCSRDKCPGKNVLHSAEPSRYRPDAKRTITTYSDKVWLST